MAAALLRRPRRGRGAGDPVTGLRSCRRSRGTTPAPTPALPVGPPEPAPRPPSFDRALRALVAALVADGDGLELTIADDGGQSTVIVVPAEGLRAVVQRAVVQRAVASSAAEPGELAHPDVDALVGRKLAEATRAEVAASLGREAGQVDLDANGVRLVSLEHFQALTSLFPAEQETPELLVASVAPSVQAAGRLTQNELEEVARRAAGRSVQIDVDAAGHGWSSTSSPSPGR